MPNIVIHEVCSFQFYFAELQGLPKQPPLELAIAHATQCLKLMSKAGIGACAFANISDFLC